jgi:cellulose synthase/poly-beta-1,6-N-acetylglucosamine synthase-like glycosyltransferase
VTCFTRSREIHLGCFDRQSKAAWRQSVISVIIPTLNEAEALPSLLRALARQGEAHEVIVADGGSDDGTVSLARTAGARVVAAPCGRGAQLAAGADGTSGQPIEAQLTT